MDSFLEALEYSDLLPEARRLRFLALNGAGPDGKLPGLRAFEQHYFAEKLTRTGEDYDWTTRTSYQAAHGSAWIVEEVFRGFGKTLHRSQILPIYSLAFGLKKFWVICSPVSRSILAEIAEMLTENARLHADLGDALSPAIDFKKQLKAFNDRQLVLRNGGCIRAQNPGEPIKGLKSPAGYRPDGIVFDDILTDKEKHSRTAREAAWEWLNNGALPACADFGKDTSVVITDAYKHKDAPASRKIREIVEKETGGTTTRWIWRKVGARRADGRLVGMTEEDYERMADLLDPVAFRQEMLGEDVATDEQLFWPDRWPPFESSSWRFARGPRRPPSVTVEIDGKPITLEVRASVLAIDPAAGSTSEKVTESQAARSDRFAMSVLGRLAPVATRKRSLYACPEIRASRAVGGVYDKQIGDIVELAMRYGVGEVLWETNGGQLFFLPQLRAALRGAGYRGRITGIPSKGPKVGRILESKRELDARDLFIGERTPVTLDEEAEAFRVWGSREHDDILETISMGLRRLRTKVTGIAIGNERIRFGGGS